MKSHPGASQSVTLDLNNPRDARTYILTWAVSGKLNLEKDAWPMVVESGAEEDLLRVAKQLFLFCDPRQAQGATCGRH